MKIYNKKIGKEVADLAVVSKIKYNIKTINSEIRKHRKWLKKYIAEMDELSLVINSNKNILMSLNEKLKKEKKKLESKRHHNKKN